MKGIVRCQIADRKNRIWPKIYSLGHTATLQFPVFTGFPRQNEAETWLPLTGLRQERMLTLAPDEPQVEEQGSSVYSDQTEQDWEIKNR